MINYDDDYCIRKFSRDTSKIGLYIFGVWVNRHNLLISRRVDACNLRHVMASIYRDWSVPEERK